MDNDKDNETAKLIKERFDALPKMVQDAILSSNYENSLLEIGKKYQLNVEQMGFLEQETTLTMMGLTAVTDFETELANELKIDKTKVAQIVADINEKVFFNIRTLLKLMNTPAGEKPSVDEEIDEKPLQTQTTKTTEQKKDTDILKSAQIEINPTNLPVAKEETKDGVLEQRTDMLSKVENPDLINKEADAKKIQSIAAQKLSGSFNIPAQKTDYSLDNISKSTNTPVASASAPKNISTSIPKTDPYREIPE
jgi:hypothetical protein